MSPTKVNFKIYQGSTFLEVLRYESATKTYVTVSSVFKTAPMQVTANSHGMPAGWRCKLSNVGGMTEVNALGYIVATSVTANDLTFNDVNATTFKDYTSGGTLEYNTPVDLTGMTARMQIREKLTSDTVIQELTTENGLIIIDNPTKTITLTIPATTTETYTFTQAVYSLELIKGTVVTPFIKGNISLEKEVTR